MTDDKSNELEQVAAALPHAPVAPAHAIAAIALTMAMKYCAINTVQDGVLYQQYKLEGRNIRPNSLEEVFEVAIQIEQHLLASSDRIAQIIVEALTVVDETETDGEAESEQETHTHV